MAEQAQLVDDDGLSEADRETIASYLAFFEGWRQHTGRPHTIEADWMRDNRTDIAKLSREGA